MGAEQKNGSNFDVGESSLESPCFSKKTKKFICLNLSFVSMSSTKTETAFLKFRFVRFDGETARNFNFNCFVLNN